MTLGLIFDHFFAKTNFGAFSVFHTKYAVIHEDKKFQTQKWWIREKFRHQKLGVTKGFFIVNFFLFLISTTFWKNDCSATYTANMSNQSATRVQLIVAKKHELQLLIASNF